MSNSKRHLVVAAKIMVILGCSLAAGAAVHRLLMPWALRASQADSLRVDHFQIGDRVRHVLDGREGIVIGGRYYPGHRYKVRFVSLEITTDSSIFGDDGPVNISPYAVVMCTRSELEKISNTREWVERKGA